MVEESERTQVHLRRVLNHMIFRICLAVLLALSICIICIAFRQWLAGCERLLSECYNTSLGLDFLIFKDIVFVAMILPIMMLIWARFKQ